MTEEDMRPLASRHAPEADIAVCAAYIFGHSLAVLRERTFRARGEYVAREANTENGLRMSLSNGIRTVSS
jgi:hypothetical protein